MLSTPKEKSRSISPAFSGKDQINHAPKDLLVCGLKVFNTYCFAGTIIVIIIISYYYYCYYYYYYYYYYYE